MTWLAYVDESMRQRNDGSGIYVLAAAMFDPEDADHIREVTRSLAHGRRRFHWRDEEPGDRLKAVDTIARLNALHLVVVGTPLDRIKQERGRRKCLERLLWHLQEVGVNHARLEARTPSLNAQDMLAVQAFRSQKIIDPELFVDFIYPAAEPLAWLPDIVAGAVSAARGDGNERYLMPLKLVLTEYRIEID